MSDPGAIWRNQPEEKTTVRLEQIVNRRTQELDSSTRSEILSSMAAALLFTAVMAWRFAPRYDPLQALGFAGILAWLAISAYRFRSRIWRRQPPPPDAAAATCLEYYRKELEQRRDHLKNAWIWHGPLLLACLVLGGTLMGKGFPGPARLPGILPLLVLLVLWTAYGLNRRHRQVKELQREIDGIEP